MQFSQHESHHLLSLVAVRFIFSANNGAEGLQGAYWFSWEFPVCGAERGCVTHNIEPCCPVCPLRCCNRERQSHIVYGGSGGGTAFLFLRYLSSDILTPDLIKKSWKRKDNVFFVGAFLHNIRFLLITSFSKCRGTAAQMGQILGSSQMSPGPQWVQSKSLSSLELLLELAWWLGSFGHVGGNERRWGSCNNTGWLYGEPVSTRVMLVRPRALTFWPSSVSNVLQCCVLLQVSLKNWWYSSWNSWGVMFATDFCLCLTFRFAINALQHTPSAQM